MRDFGDYADGRFARASVRNSDGEIRGGLNLRRLGGAQFMLWNDELAGWLLKYWTV